MLRDIILAKIRADREALSRFGLRTVALFGSVARDDARPDSDIDILVEYDKDHIPGLFAFSALKRHLEDVLGRPVDLVTPGALHPALKGDILRQAVHVDF